MEPLNCRDVFETLFPRFWESPGIRSLPEHLTYDEMVLDLSAFHPEAFSLPVPEGITFGPYEGDMAALQAAVRAVDGGWVQYYRSRERVYCACAGKEPVSFCLVHGMGEYKGLKVGGPGCVGTAPAWRRKGIGLAMVLRATALLKAEGFDLSWIHYTGVAPWYAKLGYRTVLTWNARGPV